MNWMMICFLAISLIIPIFPLDPPGRTVDLPFQVYLPLVKRTSPPVWLGPTGGSIVTLQYNPQNPSIVYAGSFGSGVFKSEDGGLSWRTVSAGLDNLFINSFVIDPRQPDTLYAGTYQSGVYKSVDGGAHWFSVPAGMQPGAVVYCMAINPENPQQVFAGTRGINTTGQPPWLGILYRSDDGGATWKEILENVGGSGAQDWVYSLAVLPRDPNVILAATHEHGPYRSDDYGATWRSVSTGVPDGSGRAVAFDPRTKIPDTAYYGTWHRTGVYRSSNSGQSWGTVNNGLPSVKIYSMAVSPANPDRLYLATFTSGIQTSDDAAGSWYSSGLSSELIYTVAPHPTGAGTALAGVVDNGIFRTTSTAGGWTPSNNGLTALNAVSVVVRPGYPSSLYVALEGRGVRVSIDGGWSWSNFSSGLTDLYIQSLAFSPSNPNLLFALARGGTLFSIDLTNPTGWKTLFAPPALAASLGDPRPDPRGPAFSSPDAPAPLAVVSAPLNELTFSPSTPAVAYLATGLGVYRSANGGQTWSPAGLGSLAVASVAVDPADAGRIFALTGEVGLVRVSQDSGATWSTESIPGVTPRALAIDPFSARMLAATSSGMYIRAADGTWSLFALPGQDLTLVRADSSGQILVAGPGAAWLSLDGLNWRPGGDLVSLKVQSAAIAPTASSAYLATPAGIVRMDFSGY